MIKDKAELLKFEIRFSLVSNLFILKQICDVGD